ncbi:ubiquitin domain-containing protein [Diplocarpon rosae]|nr:ubiquitin domain-containing protein [Diplocarpon rosae]
MGSCCSAQASNTYPPSAPNNANASSRAHINQPGSQGMGTRPSTNASSQSPANRQGPQDLTRHPTKNLKIPIWASSPSRTWTRNQIDEERVAFFDTRVTGRPEIWQTIRAALEVLWSGGDANDSDGGIATAQLILTAAGITVPGGNLAGNVYDSFGELYPLPPEIVSDPTDLVEPSVKEQDDVENKSEEGREELDEESLRLKREDKGKRVLRAEDMIEIQVKLSFEGERRLKVAISREDSVRLVNKRIFDDSGLASPKRIKLAYMGRILEENKTLDAQGFNEDNVLNAFVLG